MTEDRPPWTADPAVPLPAWTLIQASHLVAREFGQLFARAGLTPPQFGVLAELAESPGLTQAELARRTLIRPQSTGELVTALVDRGLVVRDGPAGRGRRAGLHVTEQGRAAIEVAWPLVVDFNQPARLGLSSARAAMLDELLGEVIVALGGEPDQRKPES